jgi:hypothetical protein
MCLTADRSLLIAGTSLGTVRIYAWPPVSVDGVPDTAFYVETLAHAGPVLSLVMAPHQGVLLRTGQDGTVFVHSLMRSQYDDSSGEDD